MPNYVTECKSNNLLLLGQISAYISYYFRKVILEYCKVEGKSNRNNVLMEFVRRIESNSTAIRILVEASIKNDSKSYLKLSIGLLIRSCLIDSILGLYLSAIDDTLANDPSMAKPFEYITEAIENIGGNIQLSEQMMQYCNKASVSIKKLLLKP